MPPFMKCFCFKSSKVDRHRPGYEEPTILASETACKYNIQDRVALITNYGLELFSIWKVSKFPVLQLFDSYCKWSGGLVWSV